MSGIGEPVRERGAATGLAEALDLPGPLAEVLEARGLGDVEAARRWLRPGFEDLHDPLAFAAMGRALARVEAAIRDRETVLVHGDYDVDGLTGTAVLVRALRFLGAEVQAYVPAREDGYSFTEASLARIRASGARLCLSVDNGTAAVEAIARIQADGCDVIVTDHHTPGPTPCPAFAVLNPRLPDSGYPFAELAGVGVAFKLAWALLARGRNSRGGQVATADLLRELTALAALGTVADLVPLVGENRALVKRGLEALAEPPSPGLRALGASLGPRRRPLDARDIAFGFAPRLNAAGRMAHADLALALLLADDPTRARDLARKLDGLNRSRQRAEARCFGQALNRVDELDEERTWPVVVVADEDWPLGVVGILAARLVDRYGRPALALTIDGDRPAARAQPGRRRPARPARRGRGLALRFGGHARAVGLEVPADRAPALREALASRPAAATTPAPPRPPQAEAEARLATWGRRELTRLLDLGPWGPGNAEPRFAARDLVLGPGRAASASPTATWP
ncbi:MAG: DHH family phosphoesterase [Planctomycetota bacterium]